MTYVISLINYKGGCTKTSTTVGLGAALARKDKRVLLVDCDPQSHVAAHLGISDYDIEIALEDVLGTRGSNIDEIVLETSSSNLWIAPSTRNLLRARQDLANRPKRDALLYRIIKPVLKEYDFVLIDTPPDEGLLTMNAMYASEYLIIPTPLATFPLMGIDVLNDSIDMIKEAYEERKLEILGILVNEYDGRRTRQNNRNFENLREAFGEKVFQTFIRTDEEIKEAQSHGKTIFEQAPGSKGAVDFMNLADEVIQRLV